MATPSRLTQHLASRLCTYSVVVSVLAQGAAPAAQAALTRSSNTSAEQLQAYLDQLSTLSVEPLEAGAHADASCTVIANAAVPGPSIPPLWKKLFGEAADQSLDWLVKLLGKEADQGAAARIRSGLATLRPSEIREDGQLLKILQKDISELVEADAKYLLDVATTRAVNLASCPECLRRRELFLETRKVIRERLVGAAGRDRDARSKIVGFVQQIEVLIDKGMIEPARAKDFLLAVQTERFRGPQVGSLVDTVQMMLISEGNTFDPKAAAKLINTAKPEQLTALRLELTESIFTQTQSKGAQFGAALKKTAKDLAIPVAAATLLANEVNQNANEPAKKSNSAFETPLDECQSLGDLHRGFLNELDAAMPQAPATMIPSFHEELQRIMYPISRPAHWEFMALSCGYGGFFPTQDLSKCFRGTRQEVDRLNSVIHKLTQQVSEVGNLDVRARIEHKMNAIVGRIRFMQVSLIERAISYRRHKHDAEYRSRQNTFLPNWAENKGSNWNSRYFDFKDVEAFNLGERGVEIFADHFDQISTQFHCTKGPNPAIQDLREHPLFIHATGDYGRTKKHNLPDFVEKYDQSNPSGNLLLNLINYGKEVPVDPKNMPKLKGLLTAAVTELPAAATNTEHAKELGTTAGRIFGAIKFALSKKATNDTEDEKARIALEKEHTAALFATATAPVRLGLPVAGNAAAECISSLACTTFDQLRTPAQNSHSRFKDLEGVVAHFLNQAPEMRKQFDRAPQKNKDDRDAVEMIEAFSDNFRAQAAQAQLIRIPTTDQ